MRRALQHDFTVGDAVAMLTEIGASDRHEFWPDDLAMGDVEMHGVVGHRQVTDAYLAALARSRSARLATLDRGLAGSHPDVAELVPTS